MINDVQFGIAVTLLREKWTHETVVRNDEQSHKHQILTEIV